MHDAYKSFDPNTELTEEQREKYDVVFSGDEGFHTGRTKFKVTCNTCGEVLHHNTTGPEHWIRIHEEDHPVGCK